MTSLLTNCLPTFGACWRALISNHTFIFSETCRPHLVGKVHHAQVGLYFEAEGREAGHTVLWPGELMKDYGVFRVQLLLLPTQRETEPPVNTQHCVVVYSKVILTAVSHIVSYI